MDERFGVRSGSHNYFKDNPAISKMAKINVCNNVILHFTLET